MTTDTSDYGLGVVLTQIHANNMEKTIAFASQVLTESERKYSTGERKHLDACGRQGSGGLISGVDISLYALTTVLSLHCFPRKDWEELECTWPDGPHGFCHIIMTFSTSLALKM